MNEEVAYKKTVKCANAVFVLDAGRYIDKVKYKWFSAVKFYK
jgi:hypothetical protein